MRALIVLALLARSAAAEPDNRDLFYAGLAMAPPTYLIGVTLHEGSHALAAELVGGDVTEVRLFPPGIDPKFSPGETLSEEPLVVAVGRLADVRAVPRLVVRRLLVVA